MRIFGGEKRNESSPTNAKRYFFENLALLPLDN